LNTTPNQIRKSVLRFCLAAALALISACGGGASTSVIVPSGSPGNTGGGATGAVTLSWQIPTENSDGSVLTNLNGYRVFQGTSSNTATLSEIATLNNPSLSMYVVENLGTGTYFFAITAVSSQNLESDFSNVVQISIN
jgi:hypothetical protein